MESHLDKDKKALVLATFALGTYVSYIDDDQVDAEVDVINSRLNELYKKYDIKPIEVTSQQLYSDFFNFETIKQKYLDSLSDSEVEGLNNYIVDIIKADNVIAREEMGFLNREWAPYLKTRLGKSFNFESIVGGVKTTGIATETYLAAGVAAALETNLQGPTAATGSTGATGAVLAGKEAANMADIYGRMSRQLEELNTMRGGSGGFKGFVGEELQAAEASAGGRATYVLNNNGPADLVFIGKNGHKYYQQMKMGYTPAQIKKMNFESYRGQTLLVDKENPYFDVYKAEGAKHGVKVVRSSITDQEAQSLAKWMQRETQLTGAKSATVVPKLASAHRAGVHAGKTGALYGAGFSFSTNLVDVIFNDKKASDAAVDVAKDTAVSYAAGYAVGAAGSAIAGTSAGAAAIGAASSAGAAIASTTVGGAVVGAGTAAAAAVGGAGVAATSAVVGAAGAVGSAVGGAAVAATAGTAVGGAVAGGVAVAGAAGAAIGAAAVAAAPVVAVGAAVGLGYKLLKGLFGD